MTVQRDEAHSGGETLPMTSDQADTGNELMLGRRPDKHPPLRLIYSATSKSSGDSMCNDR